METYHRKRSKRVNNNEIISLKGKDVCSKVDGAQGQAPSLARQPLPDTNDEVSNEEVELGSVYELYHKNLPPWTPVQLRSTRIVWVSEKTDMNVSIRYPSRLSLMTYKSNGVKEMYPALDEKFVMELNLARKVLLRKVPSFEFATKKNSDDFWCFKSNFQSDQLNMKKNNDDDLGLARVLKNNNMLRWGTRRQVTFIGNKKETIKRNGKAITPNTFDLPMNDTFIEHNKETSEIPSTFGLLIGDTITKKHKETCDTDVGLVKDDTLRKHKETSDTPSTFGLIINDQEVKNQRVNGADEIEEEGGEVEHETDQEDDDEADELKGKKEVEEEKDDLGEEQKSTRILRKRKRGKQVKQGWCKVNKKPMKKCKKLLIRKPTDRWSKERYMAAELGLLEAMKEKKAMIGNPITRPALRVEARKRIGDTGLLDHLLKHVANKVAPGGTLRFRRSHNADGTMLYWLEDADLLKMKKEAGVTDPLWIPPPGWKPGDLPTLDPILAKELNHLKEEISCIKRDYLPKKQVEDEMAGLRREIQELTLKYKQEQSQRIVTEDVDTSPLQVMDICKLLLHSESETSDVDDSVLKKGQHKKQLVLISEILKKIQAWMQASEDGEESAQMKAVESPKAAATLLITATASPNAQEKPKVAADENQCITPAPKQPNKEKSEQSGHVSPPAAAQIHAPSPPEGKAAKIERLKSGFRLCRPQGTFLWPNMTNTNTNTSSATNISSTTHVVEDLLQVVPTPPSVNSSTAYHHHHLPSPPIKPVPERRPVTVSSLSEGLPPPPPTPTTTLLNLNDIPTNISSQHIIKLQPLGTNFSAENKKRKSPSSMGSGSSDTPSCLSNPGGPANWLTVTQAAAHNGSD